MTPKPRRKSADQGVVDGAGSLDPLALLSAEELAKAMRMSGQELLEAERRGRVFRTAFSANGKPQAGYLGLQALVDGETMRAIIDAFRRSSRLDLYLFLRSLNRDLGGLSPSELLLGRKQGERRLTRDGWVLLRMRRQARVEAVVAAARCAANIRDYW